MAGSRRSNEPRHIKKVLNDYFEKSNEPLAKGYRKHLASTKIDAEKGGEMKRNTELCVDVKTFMHNDVLMMPGVFYTGYMRRDVPCEEYGFDDHHYTFIEAQPTSSGNRNPRVFDGEYITMTLDKDGNLRPNFKIKKLKVCDNIEAYAFGVANELIMALKGLVE